MSELPSPPPSRPTLSRRRALTAAGAVAGATGLTLAGTTAGASGAPVPASGAKDFVAVRGGTFRLRGRPFRFAGTNCYYLHQQSHYMIDAVLNDAKAMGLSVVRAWAFCDGQRDGQKALQPAPYTYDEAAFDSLDYAVWKAGRLGIRLVLPFVNNWPDYGGMSQYVAWLLKLPDDVYSDDPVHHDRFYTEPAIRSCYKAWVRHVVRRRNRYTGLRYRDDPTIMTWQLGNEPRCRSDKSGKTLLAWVTEMSAFVRQQAPKQLVAVGDEGMYGDPSNPDYPYSAYEGARWRDFVALPTVDYGTVHVYAVPWGETTANGKDPVAWGETWIGDHVADAKKLGKPMVLEEYGLNVGSDPAVPDQAARVAAYERWGKVVEEAGYAASDQFWILTSRVDDGSLYPDYDGYRVVWWNDDAANPTNALARSLAAHAARMAQPPG